MAAAQLGFDCSLNNGAGAAGGLGYAFMQFMNAKIRSGADVLLETVNFNSLIEDADLIITGEGSADSQTLMGKIPVRVLEYGLRKNIPVMLIAGKVKDAAALLKAGFSKVQCIKPQDMLLTEAMKPTVAKENIRKAIMQL
jgi:putative glycerate kinase